MLALVLGTGRICLAVSSNVESRDLQVDRALADLETGNRMAASAGHPGHGVSSKTAGSQLSPRLDTGAASKGARTPASSVGGPAPAISGPISAPAAPAVTAPVTASESPVTAPSPIESPVGGGGPVGGGTETGGGIAPAPETEIGGGTETGGGTPPAPEPETGGEPGGGINVDLGVEAGVGDVVLDTGAGVHIDNSVIDEQTGLSTDTDVTIDTVIQQEEAVDVGADVMTEVDTSGGSTGTEADAGIEADISGATGGDVPVSDPADGLF